MPIAKNHTEIAFFSHLLKGNWQKGVTNLRYIMSVPKTACEFLKNPNALQVVYGVADKNSQQLIDVVEEYGYGDQGITGYLNRLFDWDFARISEIAAKQEEMQAVVDCPQALLAICASHAARAAIALDPVGLEVCAPVKDAMEAIVADAVAVQNIFVSETLMGIVVNDTVAMTALLSYQPAWTVLCSQQSAWVEVIKHLPALELVCKDSAAVTIAAKSKDMIAGIVANDEALQILIANKENVTILAAARPAMDALMADTTALNTVLDMSVVYSIILDNRIAVAALVAVPSAINALVDKEPPLLFFVKNTNAMTTGSTNLALMKAIAGQNNAVKTLYSNNATMTLAAKQANSVKALMIQNTTSRNTLVSYNAAMDVVVKEAVAMKTLAADATTINYYLSNNNFATRAANSKIAMVALAANVDAITTFLKLANYVGQGLNTLGELNNSSLRSQATMALVVGNEQAMEAVSSSAAAMNAIVKSTAARRLYAGSGHIGRQYARLSTSLAQTTYFSVNNATSSSVDGVYYNVGSGWVTSTTSATAAIGLLTQVYSWTSNTTDRIVRSLDNTNLSISWRTFSSSPTTREMVMPGGVFTTGQCTCRVYVPKTVNA